MSLVCRGELIMSQHCWTDWIMSQHCQTEQIMSQCWRTERIMYQCCQKAWHCWHCKIKLKVAHSCDTVPFNIKPIVTLLLVVQSLYTVHLFRVEAENNITAGHDIALLELKEPGRRNSCEWAIVLSEDFFFALTH